MVGTIQRIYGSIIAAVFLALMPWSVVDAAAGTVVFVRHNFYVVETDRGYSVMECYREKDPEEGDAVSGPLDRVALQKIRNETAKRDLWVWVYDYWLTEEQAHELLKQRGVEEWKVPFQHY